jgi:hypothetical protein
MALFAKKDDPVRAQRDSEAALKAKIAQGDDNARRLQIAEGRLDQARVNVEALALEPDEAKLDAALQARRAAEDKLAALNGAAVKIGAEIASIEAEIERFRDGLMRAETSAAITDMVNRLEMAETDFEGIAHVLEDILREAALLVIDAHPAYDFVGSARAQLPPAIAVIKNLLKGRAHGVLNGGLPASLPRAAPASAPLQLVHGTATQHVVQGPEMRTVFLMRHVCFTVDGQHSSAAENERRRAADRARRQGDQDRCCDRGLRSAQEGAWRRLRRDSAASGALHSTR